jgi:hypothetical protein
VAEPLAALDRYTHQALLTGRVSLPGRPWISFYDWPGDPVLSQARRRRVGCQARLGHQHQHRVSSRGRERLPRLDQDVQHHVRAAQDLQDPFFGPIVVFLDPDRHPVVRAVRHPQLAEVADRPAGQSVGQGLP